jgi:hypothetical protein
MTFTVYIQILREPTDMPIPGDWQPWLPCTSVEETVQLAANKHLNERGGVLAGETYQFTVVAYTDAMVADSGRTKTGNPRVMMSTTFSATHCESECAA